MKLDYIDIECGMCVLQGVNEPTCPEGPSGQDEMFAEGASRAVHREHLW